MLPTYSSLAIKCGGLKTILVYSLATCLFLSLLAPTTIGSAFESVPIVELEDANFEHDTQAATGQTTGRW